MLPVREGLLVVIVELRIERRGHGLSKFPALRECEKTGIVGHGDWIVDRKFGGRPANASGPREANREV